jgi:gliding motility-associated-like protein
MTTRILLFMLLLVRFDAFAQALFYSNGATIVNSTILRINGSFENANTGTFLQESSLHVKGDFLNTATFINSGIIDLEGNFTNNGILIANAAGALNLIGNNQILEGDSAIHLNHIAALGNGKKELLRNVQTATLALNDREFSLNNNVLFVSSVNLNAITRTIGFVSAAFQGALKRKLLANTTYVFPLGWEATYSPITLSVPIDSAEIEARFAFVDASAEDLPRSFVDSSICSTNANFYHLIKGNTNTGFSISIKIDSLLTLPFTNLCSRATSGAAIWQLNNNLNATSTNSVVTFTGNETGTNDRAFLLCRKRPQQPSISGDSAVCENEISNIYQAENFGNNALIWSAAGGNILGSTFAPTASVNWITAQSGEVSLTATDFLGCSSLPTNFTVNILPNPTAQFISNLAELPFEDQVFTFINNTVDAPFFTWTINNQGPFVDSVLQWTFNEPGDYLVTLLATNNFGCTDTAQKKITIVEGLLFPNSFSPNDDGINDELSFTNSGLQNFSVVIFDRWGTIVFETTFSKLSWNGRDVAGKLLPAGTYFYLLNASSSENKYEKRGAISLFY